MLSKFVYVYPGLVRFNSSVQFSGTTDRSLKIIVVVTDFNSEDIIKTSSLQLSNYSNGQQATVEVLVPDGGFINIAVMAENSFGYSEKELIMGVNVEKS